MSDRFDDLRIDLWTSRDMIFVVKGKGQIKIKKHTACYKPPYSESVKKYLKWMEKLGLNRPEGSPKAVGVVLEGQIRYGWRTDFLTKSEYGELMREKKDRGFIVRVLGKK